MMSRIPKRKTNPVYHINLVCNHTAGQLQIFADIGADHWQTNTFSALKSAFGSY